MRQTKETVAEREAATQQAEEEAARAQRAVEEARRAVQEARAMRDSEAAAEVSCTHGRMQTGANSKAIDCCRQKLKLLLQRKLLVRLRKQDNRP